MPVWLAAVIYIALMIGGFHLVFRILDGPVHAYLSEKYPEDSYVRHGQGGRQKEMIGIMLLAILSLLLYGAEKVLF